MAQKKKILIIDDGATTIAWASKNLRQAGYKTVSRDIAIGSGAAILREQPDLVLMDIMMPAYVLKKWWQTCGIPPFFRESHAAPGFRLQTARSPWPGAWSLSTTVQRCGELSYVCHQFLRSYMPALQGDEIIRDFSKNKAGRDIRIVLHSSLALDELAKRAEACGADGFIQKTNNQQEFIHQIEKHLCDLPKEPKETNHDQPGQILVLSDEPFLIAAIKIMTSDFSQFEVLRINDEMEAAQILKNREVIRLVVVELRDDRPTSFSKTVSLLFDTYITIPVILIGKDERKVGIGKRRNTFFIRSDPLRRKDLRDAVLSFLPPLH